MTRIRRVTIAVLAVLSLAMSAPAAIAGSFSSDHKCSPGQHGNNHPGFKPGSC